MTKTTGALALACALATALAPGRALATDILADEGEAPIPHRFRSPQNFAVEIKFGPYRPDVDSEFDNRGTVPRTPYKDYFGNGRHLLSQLELDWQVFRRFGTFALGVGVGYFSVTGTAPVGTGTGLPSGDQSTLKVVPFSLSGVYRFDYLLMTRDFPLVPYGKLGVDYAYWSNTDGNGEIATDGMGGRGRGGTRGWHAAAGLELILDVFDPEAARDFDADLGVNHTALTFEVSRADLSGLGRANQLHLGDTTWSLGLLMEF
ncbi:MAG: hypothetical protein JWM82_1863 [Myxococcales bacterium]|nr:hypothetical protein [Myxococcales bacterium]